MTNPKLIWKPGNMLYPLPVVIVSCGNKEKHNLITIAWTGTLCTTPPMVYISVRPERYSYELIKSSKEFTINLVDKDLAFAADFCGVRSGRDVDKFKTMRLTPVDGVAVACPYVAEIPLPTNVFSTSVQPNSKSNKQVLSATTTVAISNMESCLVLLDIR
jgi:flavin reductase (DIM6/NTAB) family NADH-FMN oxidoreductase RutF